MTPDTRIRATTVIAVLRDGRTVGAGNARSTPIETMIEAMAGRALDRIFPVVPHRPGEVVLELRAAPGERTPRSVDLELRRVRDKLDAGGWRRVTAVRDHMNGKPLPIEPPRV